MEHGLAEQIQFDSLLLPKSREEEFVEILDRVNTNAKYRCKFCGHTFSGGNQKIRVHITGLKEGGSSVKPCSNPSVEAVEFCSQPRTSYKRLLPASSTHDVKPKPKKIAKQSDGTQLSSVYTEAWNLLHAPSKLRDIDGTDELTAPSLPVSTATTAQSLQHLLDAYGVEKAEDLALLEHVHLLKIAGHLKVVPRKVFLDMLSVPAPPAV